MLSYYLAPHSLVVIYLRRAFDVNRSLHMAYSHFNYHSWKPVLLLLFLLLLLISGEHLVEEQQQHQQRNTKAFVFTDRGHGAT
jgi:hypothetical protein